MQCQISSWLQLDWSHFVLEKQAGLAKETQEYCQHFKESEGGNSLSDYRKKEWGELWWLLALCSVNGIPWLLFTCALLLTANSALVLWLGICFSWQLIPNLCSADRTKPRLATICQSPYSTQYGFSSNILYFHFCQFWVCRACFPYSRCMPETVMSFISDNILQWPIVTFSQLLVTEETHYSFSWNKTHRTLYTSAIGAQKSKNVQPQRGPSIAFPHQ